MTARYAFIDEKKACVNENGKSKYPVVKMCEWLQVSTSGFYDWLVRPLSATATRREYLKLLITRAFTDSDGTYGYRRIHAQLVRWGERCTPELVRGLLRELRLVACQPRPRRYGLTESGPAGPIPDLVAFEFTADAPGTKMVGDVTFIPTWEGWLYLATVIDCHIKAVIGWAMADNFRTPLISDALTMAVRNNSIRPNPIFHSGRGSNYTSEEYGRLLAHNDIRQSVGRTGICYDNALAESFFAALKNERMLADTPHPVSDPRTRPQRYCTVY